MSRLDKAKERMRSKPKGYTYTEAMSLLEQLGFKESNKGKTSGSRIKFYREVDGKMVLLHKPHPGDVMSPGAVNDLVKYLIEIGEL